MPATEAPTFTTAALLDEDGRWLVGSRSCQLAAGSHVCTRDEHEPHTTCGCGPEYEGCPVWGFKCCDDPACDHPACESRRVRAWHDAWRHEHPDAPDQIETPGEPYRDSRAAKVAAGQDTRGGWNDNDPEEHAAQLAAIAEKDGSADRLLAHLQSGRWVESTHKLAAFEAEVALLRRGVGLEWRNVTYRDPAMTALQEATGAPEGHGGYRMQFRLAPAVTLDTEPEGTQGALVLDAPPPRKPPATVTEEELAALDAARYGTDDDDQAQDDDERERDYSALDAASRDEANLTRKIQARIAAQERAEATARPVKCPACAGRHDVDHRYSVWAKADGSDPVNYICEKAPRKAELVAVLEHDPDTGETRDVTSRYTDAPPPAAPEPKPGEQGSLF